MILNFFKKYWKYILIVLLVLTCFLSIRSCMENQKEIQRQKHNIAVSLDSVRYYKDKNDGLYAEKLSYIATQKELNDLNSALSDSIKLLNRKLLAGVITVITVRDTIKIEKIITIDPDIPTQSFSIPFKDDILSANLGMIYHYNNRFPYLDIKRFDYELNIPMQVYFTKDFSVILKSTGKNNITFSNVESFIDPALTKQLKPKRYGIGFSAGVGVSPYNLVNGKWGVYAFPYIGVSLNYNLINF